MNRYKHRFICNCPSNKQPIIYELKIKSAHLILVEHIVAACAIYQQAYHEKIADDLHHQLGGKQELRAHHHGVDIVTVRGEPDDERFSKRPLGYVSRSQYEIIKKGAASLVATIGPRRDDSDVQIFAAE